MSAEVTITQTIEVMGLAGGDEFVNHLFTSGTAPVETVTGRPVVSNAAVTLDLGDIAAGSGYLLYVEALVGNVYILLGATAGIPENTTSELYIPAGEGYIIPINPNSTAIPGVRLISDQATTGKFKYMLIGK